MERENVIFRLVVHEERTEIAVLCILLMEIITLSSRCHVSAIKQGM